MSSCTYGFTVSDTYVVLGALEGTTALLYFWPFAMAESALGGVQPYFANEINLSHAGIARPVTFEVMRLV